ncbi:uncharacterized protein J3D65DRAFT_144795 [Phyllosticta citribraziliensis]|uniref:Uncharacterized protein n=1 Tax=Phyllosticta citribraziliensis TaxID=989973 RepID=A0ABR1L6Y3_9PEZI
MKILRKKTRRPYSKCDGKLGSCCSKIARSMYVLRPASCRALAASKLAVFQRTTPSCALSLYPSSILHSYPASQPRYLLLGPPNPLAAGKWRCLFSGRIHQLPTLCISCTTHSSVYPFDLVQQAPPIHLICLYQSARSRNGITGLLPVLILGARKVSGRGGLTTSNYAISFK